ncbi:MAG: hypothetical protein QGH38_01225 [Candidatus Thalassarchaeaceae archaeon]|nr:hypothetical protein [Candidatus Thalassarchaeaceae archaeon]
MSEVLPTDGAYALAMMSFCGLMTWWSSNTNSSDFKVRFWAIVGVTSSFWLFSTILRM